MDAAEFAALVPELDVADLARSRMFYVDLVGFTELFGRPHEAFVYLRLGRADLMLEEADGPGRRFRTAPLEVPFGRGMNLQIEHPFLDSAHDRLVAAGAGFIVPLETRIYETGTTAVSVRQFVVADPDGYLIRLQQRSSSRPLGRPSDGLAS